MAERPTKPQRAVLNRLGNRHPDGADSMTLAHLLYGHPSAARVGKVNALLKRCREKGWVTGDSYKGWNITEPGLKALRGDWYFSAEQVIDLMAMLQKSLKGKRRHRASSEGR